MASERQNQIDDPKTSSTIVVGVVGAVLVLVIIFALQTFFYRTEEAERVNKVYAQPPEELSRVRAEQQSRLSQYEWVDKENGVLAIPIERAMELVVEREGDKDREDK